MTRSTSRPAHNSWWRYRDGRQAIALEVFQRTRDQLRDALGVDPSPSLASVHERVLRQDVDLAPPPRCLDHTFGYVDHLVVGVDAEYGRIFSWMRHVVGRRHRAD